MSKPTPPPAHKEPLKPFADTLRMIERGEFIEVAAEELREMNVKLSEHAASNGKAKGKLTITFEVTHEKGMVIVTPEITVKIPKAKRAPTALFLTEGNNLSRTDPQQMEIGDAPRILRDADVSSKA